MTNRTCLRLHPLDNVVVASTALAAGADLGFEGVRSVVGVAPGHKLAIESIARGTLVRKLGQPIGVATSDISPGDWVHDHNIRNPETHEIMPALADGGIRQRQVIGDSADLPTLFQGFRRPDGRAATRNYIGILTTVNCSATVAREIADAFRGRASLEQYPQIDGVVALTHTTGCGMQAGSVGHNILRRTIDGYLRHANFAGVLLIGLGCEVNGLGLYASSETTPSGHLEVFDIQSVGGTREAIRKGIACVRSILEKANAVKREPIPVSELVVGLQCGGSDAFSALSANPALGAAADLLVQRGGTVLLSETPEVAAWAEQLCARAVAPDVAVRMRETVSWWERHAAANGASLDGNPSPGNRAGGLSTIAEKALGAIAKGGQSPLSDVIGYAEPLRGRGLVFMDSPGFDPVSATGQVASGANLICFTTGRGSVFGAKPVPSLKLATNSEVFARLRDDMDIDCGKVLSGESDLATLGREIYLHILDVASGQRTRSEHLGIGDNEFAPWQLGVVL